MSFSASGSRREPAVTAAAPRPKLDKVVTADFIMDMCKQMSRMAADADLHRLSWMLEVVKIEANHAAKPTPGGMSKKTRRKRPDRRSSEG